LSLSMTREHQNQDQSQTTTSQQERFWNILKNHANESSCTHSVAELFAEIKRIGDPDLE
jgi:hypothetical protein